MDNKSYRNVIVERKAGSGCLVFPLWGRSINIDSWVQPRGPRLSRSGVGPRNVRSIKHSGDSGASAPKARLGKATPWFISFSYLFFKMHPCTLTQGGIALLGF